jgi:hypothetical protein
LAGRTQINELASQNMFMHQLLLRPTEEELANHKADFTIVSAPGFKCIPELDGVHSEAAIILSFERKLVIVAGSALVGLVATRFLAQPLVTSGRRRIRGWVVGRIRTMLTALAAGLVASGREPTSPPPEHS